MQFDKIVSGGKVVTPGGILDADVGIKGEKIEAVGMDLPANGGEKML